MAQEKTEALRCDMKIAKRKIHCELPPLAGLDTTFGKLHSALRDSAFAFRSFLP